jgi:lipid-A-disaccharide synthase
MRYFFSTGEASGEVSATLLAGAIAAIDAQAQFEGIGSERMRAMGFRLWNDTRGWSTMGIFEALRSVPKLWLIMWRNALRLRANPPDLIVLVDFGAVHLRLAKTLRAIGYRRPILYFFPPGAWLDKLKQAKAAADLSIPLVAFEHQRDFYRAQGLPVHFFGHPLPPSYAMRPARATPPPDGGTIAILPGSRAGELKRHLPVLLEAYAELRARRPNLRAFAGAADTATENAIREELRQRNLPEITIRRTAAAAIADADAAWIASGTAVLEAALSGVPSIALYILSDAQARIARRIYSGPYITIPNLALKKRVVPEILQEAATPARLASEMETVLRNPQAQYEQLLDLRHALGPEDALQQCARFAVSLAGS